MVYYIGLGRTARARSHYRLQEAAKAVHIDVKSMLDCFAERAYDLERNGRARGQI